MAWQQDLPILPILPILTYVYSKPNRLYVLTQRSASQRKMNITIKDGQSGYFDRIDSKRFVLLKEGQSLEVVETINKQGDIDKYICKVPNSDWQKVVVYAENIKENA